MSVQAEARRIILEDELKRYVDILVDKEEPEKVIVFGSLATDDVKEWSDIDLVVVKDTELPFIKRMRELRKVIQPKVAVDILCYTSDEFIRLCNDRLFFQEEIVGKGRVLYDRPN